MLPSPFVWNRHLVAWLRSPDLTHCLYTFSWTELGHFFWPYSAISKRIFLFRNIFNRFQSPRTLASVPGSPRWNQPSYVLPGSANFHLGQGVCTTVPFFPLASGLRTGSLFEGAIRVFAKNTQAHKTLRASTIAGQVSPPRSTDTGARAWDTDVQQDRESRPPGTARVQITSARGQGATKPLQPGQRCLAGVRGLGREGGAGPRARPDAPPPLLLLSAPALAPPRPSDPARRLRPG